MYRCVLSTVLILVAGCTEAWSPFNYGPQRVPSWFKEAKLGKQRDEMYYIYLQRPTTDWHPLASASVGSSYHSCTDHCLPTYIADFPWPLNHAHDHKPLNCFNSRNTRTRTHAHAHARTHTHAHARAKGCSSTGGPSRKSGRN